MRAAAALLGRLERMGVLRLPTVRWRRAARQPRDCELAAELILVPGASWPVAMERSAPLVVRPIVEAERLGWQAHMQRYHYLGDCRLVGESLRYVASAASGGCAGTR